MAETETEAPTETRTSSDWLVWSIPEEEMEELLLRAEDAEITQVMPLPPFLLGALSAIALALGLLVASL